MNTYFALTIGPIQKTLLQAQRTREFWGSSYLFSWIMREIINGLIEKKSICKEDILMPNRDSHNNPKMGTGLYHDRMIAQINTDKKDIMLRDFKEIADKVMNKISKASENSVVDMALLQSYFRLNAIFLNLENEKNIVEIVTNYLDSLELQNPIFHESFKIDWQELIFNLNKNIFYDDAAVDRFFPSIPEIATKGLVHLEQKRYQQYVKQEIYQIFQNDNLPNKKNETTAQDNFIKELSNDPNFRDAFHNYHKYVAIVHADGDNLGDTIRKIGDKAEEVKRLSRALFSFASKAVDNISLYGGTNVYAGGDDLLFFAPVAILGTNGQQTIFDLISELDELFNREICRKPEISEILPNIWPTLSWGVSISYYKFPLTEALNSSRNLLFNDAKNYEGKNAVAFKLTKHSGQSFGATFGKGSNVYKQFIDLLNNKFNNKTEFINSLQYHIFENQALIKEVLRIEDDYERETKITNYFTNFFDEEIHYEKNDFISNVQKILIHSFNDSYGRDNNHDQRVNSAIDITYSALRFIHCLNSKSDE